MHRDDVYPCMSCHATPFHLGCLEPHYEKAHPRPQHHIHLEEEILQEESDEARSQWVDQMTNLSNSAMPLGRKITSTMVALVSVGLAVGPFWSSVDADAPASLLQ